MILLDTHIWIWWVHDDARLPANYRVELEAREAEGLGVSVISCWKIAKLVEYNRLVLPVAVEEWLGQASSYPHVQLLDLKPRIAVESTQLPAPFYRNPADQIIVATARVHHCPLMTIDSKIRDYAGV